MELKRVYHFVLSTFVGFVILTGCVTGEVEDELGPADLNPLSPETDLQAPTYTLSAMYITGDYLPEYDDEFNSFGVENGFTCSYNGNVFYRYLEGLETNRPYIWSRSEMACYRLDDRGDAWFVSCWTFVPSFDLFPSYWIREYFFLEKYDWEDKEYIGWFFQWVDVHGVMGCTRTFGITDADLEFVEE